MLRVITGTAKGRRLRAGSGQDVRPTADRVKEALFNVLAPRIVGAVFLDAFAGSGAVGIEALSRGAAAAVFVDNRRQSLDLVRHNLQSTGLASAARLLALDARAAFERLARERASFDIVFIDPPYGDSQAAAALKALVASGIVAAAGLVVVEHHSKDCLPAAEGDLERVRQLSFGETVLSLYRRTSL